MSEELYVPIDHNFKQKETNALRRFEDTRPPEYWDYRYLWNTLPKIGVVTNFPIHLDIDVTNRCNLKCIMCPRTELVKEGEFWEEGDLSPYTYRGIVDDGIKSGKRFGGLRSIKYNILGEPLLHSQLNWMIWYAKNVGVVDTMLNTNGALLTESLSKSLIMSGLDKLFFSFDSPNRETYNKIRIGTNYDKVLGNIKRFMEIREEFGSINPLTRVSMVLMDINQHEWDDFEKLFAPIVDTVGQSIFIKHTGQKEDRTVKELG